MIFAAALLTLSLSAFAEEPTVPTVEVTPAPTAAVSPGGSGATMRGRTKRPRNTPRDSRKMPPAGSAATGGTSSSPGGAPTTPYGSPD